MDPHRFDEWTRALAAGASRRTFLVGVLKGGAAALGLAGAASAQTELPPTAAQCQRRWVRCVQRSSFKRCARCIDEVLASGCPAPVIDPTGYVTTAQILCSCTTDSYCADGNGCTLDICSSNVCYNDPIEGSCVQCRKNRHCPNGGTCCNGRCCPAGKTCQVNGEGIGVCCEACTNGETCCQNITIAGNPNLPRGYVVALATCVGQEGVPFDLPTFCCGGCGGGYGDLNDPTGGPGCFCPQRSLP